MAARAATWSTWVLSEMRVVALISGGKDSCYGMMQCVSAGHQVVALANLQPAVKDELDSYMFQSVGHEGVALYAAAMDLPLFQVSTQGQAIARDMVYSVTEGDEVEDLFQLLRQVKEEVGVEAVSSGAVLSNYQRLRVENVCVRLGLVSLGYLWRREQDLLLREMVAAGVKAIVIKVAVMGLTPEKHLGRSIEELYPQLLELHKQYGINMCGEGGEYETFTLDCPLFHKKIVVDSSEVRIHSDDAFAPVGYLYLSQLHLEDKPGGAQGVPVSPRPCELIVSPCQPEPMLLPREAQCVQRGPHSWIAVDGSRELGSAAEQTQQLFTVMDGLLSASGQGWPDVGLVYLYLANMAHFAEVNAVYRPHFHSSPPARVCVQVSLPEGVLVRMEMLVCGSESGGGRSSMHVQSVSHWAPANIGPYSQAYMASNLVLTAGQIGLIPGSMALGRSDQEAELALTHVNSVLEACHTHLNSALLGICYYTGQGSGWGAREAWRQCVSKFSLVPGCPMAFLPVPALPRGASVEWHFVAVGGASTVTYVTESTVQQEVGVVTTAEAWCAELMVGCWMVTVAPLPSCRPHLPTAVRLGFQHLGVWLARRGLCIDYMTTVRLCVPKYATGLSEDVCRAVGNGGMPLSLISVEGYYGLDCPLVLQAVCYSEKTKQAQNRSCS